MDQLISAIRLFSDRLKKEFTLASIVKIDTSAQSMTNKFNIYAIIDSFVSIAGRILVGFSSVCHGNFVLRRGAE